MKIQAWLVCALMALCVAFGGGPARAQDQIVGAKAFWPAVFGWEYEHGQTALGLGEWAGEGRRVFHVSSSSGKLEVIEIGMFIPMRTDQMFFDSVSPKPMDPGIGGVPARVATAWVSGVLTTDSGFVGNVIGALSAVTFVEVQGAQGPVVLEMYIPFGMTKSRPGDGGTGRGLLPGVRSSYPWAGGPGGEKPLWIVPIAIGGCALKIGACAADTAEAIADCMKACDRNFPPAAAASGGAVKRAAAAAGQTSNQKCRACCARKGEGDASNCLITCGVNEPDDDYGNCIEEAKG